MTDRPVFAVDGRLRWVPSTALLGVSAVLYALSRLLPVVTAADGSDTSAPVRPWWIGLPVLIAVLVAMRCGTGSAGVIVATGTVAAGRSIADLGLFLNPDAVLRPELFGVDSVAAFPLAAGWGSVVVVASDLLALVAAGLAARVVLDGWETPARRPPADRAGADTPILTFRFGPATMVGLMAVALLVVSSPGVLYASPLPVVRPLGLADIGVFGLVGAMLGSLLVGGVVLMASTLPARAARGLLLGAGAATAVAPLTALTAGGDVRPTGLAWVGFVGALLLAVAGLLVSVPTGTRTPADDAESPDRYPTNRLAAPALGALVLLAGGAALLAYREPQATTTFGERLASFDAAGAAFLPAAVLLLAIGVLMLIPATAGGARVALRLGWLPVGAAVLISLEFTASSVWVSSAIFGAGGVQRAAGSWWGIGGAALAVLAAVFATVLDHRLADRDATSSADPSEDVDRLDTMAAWGLSALVVAAFAVPVFSANDRVSAAMFVGGARVDTYAAWLLAIGSVAGIWAGCRHPRSIGVATLLVTVGLVALTRVALTPAVQHQVRFEVRTGLVLTIVLTVGAVAAAGVLSRRRRTTPGPVARTPSPSRPVVTIRAKRS
ncbi:MAG: hypothetical protein ABJA16_04260 [Nakamurella sp.]